MAAAATRAGLPSRATAASAAVWRPRAATRAPAPRAGTDNEPKPSTPAPADDDLWIERELRRRAKKRAAADKGAGPTVVAPAVAKARATAAGEGTALDAVEIGYRRFLGFFGTAILAEGLVLGGSGFLPDAWDAWISNTLYPSFSATVGVFLLCSSAYGVWKSKQGDGGFGA